MLFRFYFLFGLLVFGLSAPAHAALGDDLPKLRAAYGSAHAVGGQMLFTHDGFSICVYFDGTVSAMEVFVRDPATLDFTETDIDRILAAEGGGLGWTKITSRTGKPTWLRSDAKVVARFSGESGTKSLVVMLNQT